MLQLWNVPELLGEIENRHATHSVSLSVAAKPEQGVASSSGLSSHEQQARMGRRPYMAELCCTCFAGRGHFELHKPHLQKFTEVDRAPGDSHQRHGKGRLLKLPGCTGSTP